MTSVDTGQPVASARVAIPGVGRTRTKANGRFVIRTKRGRAGTARVKIRAPGHIVRLTNVVVPAPGGKVVRNWNLLPRASDGFDLTLFDTIARPDGVIRWETPPTFRIIRNRLECRGGLVDGSCVEWFASTTPVPEPMLGWLRLGAAEMGTLATSGRPPRIVEIELSPGQAFDFDEALLLENTFTLGHIVANFRSSFRQAGLSPEATATKLALFGASDSERKVRAVIAEGLGFYGPVGANGCDGVLGRGLASFFCSSAILAPTDLDLAFGRALYSRAIGNQAPDRDPVE